MIDCKQELGSKGHISFRDKLMTDDEKGKDDIMDEVVDIEILKEDLRTRKENGITMLEFSDSIQILCAKSDFPFETNNLPISKTIHGSTSLDTTNNQVVHNYSINDDMPLKYL